MTVPQTISSRRNPIVGHFRAIARGDDRTLLLLDGAHLVQAALDAGLRFETVLVSADAVARPDIAAIVDRIARRDGVVVASAAVMDAVSPVKSASDIVALAARRVWTGDAIYTADTPVVIAADVQDPGNLGAIVRVAHAGGAAGVVAAGKSANPFAWKALRGSMGSALGLPIIVDADIAAAVDAARRHGRRIIATVARGGTPYLDVDLRRASAILIGGEASGLPADVVGEADLRVTIPMAEGVESLNAATAAAILIYEARRQRTSNFEVRSSK